MADHTAIAAVSRTLRTLLLDRLAMNAAVTIAPPDLTIANVDGPRANLYLYQVIENAALKNQENPSHGHPAAYGRPPLSLNLRYLLTTQSATENQTESDLNAQEHLGDAMRVLHDFGNQLDSLRIVNPAAGPVGSPVLDAVLREEYERIKIVLHPIDLDELTKVWSALSDENFRRSVAYEVTVVQIETIVPRPAPRPVETRRIFASVRRRPVTRRVYVTPGANEPIGELRVRVGEEITIVAENSLAERLFVQFGALDPIRIPPPGDGHIRITLPDSEYPVDLDHAAPRPIPIVNRLQPGVIEIRVIAEHPTDGVEGGLGHGKNFSDMRRYASNTALLQLVPQVTDVTPPSGTAATVLRVEGTRLWHDQAELAEVIIADAAVRIRQPATGDAWAAPTPTAVEIPVSDAAALLPALSPGDAPYPVAVQVDGARSRDPGFGFTLEA